jgi:3-phytase
MTPTSISSAPFHTQTDGLDAFSGPIDGYPEGAIGMHGHFECDTKQQCDKLVDWRAVKAALGIR